MQVTFENGNFVCRDAWKFKDSLRDAGFDFNQVKKTWSTRLWYEAKKFTSHFDAKAAKLWAAHTLRVDPDPEYLLKLFRKDPVAFTLFNRLDPVQKSGVKFAATRNHSYLAFDAGVGKTATYLIADYIEAKRNPLPACLIVPPHLIRNWQDEFKMWRPGERICVIENHTDFEKFRTHLNGAPETYLVANSLLQPDKVFGTNLISECIKEMRFRTVGVDEAHEYSNFEAQRTKEMYGDEWSHGSGIVHRGDKVILLSGTHMDRGPINLFAPIFALAWNTVNFSSSSSYGVRFCNGFRQTVRGREIWNFKGSSREDEFQERIYNKFVFEKSLEEARPELKGKKKQRLVTLDVGIFAKRNIENLERERIRKRTIEDYISDAKPGDIEEYREKFGLQMVRPAYYYIKEKTKDFKIPAVIFCVHHAVIDKVLSEFEDAGIREISGRVPKKKRLEVQRLFQKGKLNLVVWQVQSAVGQNLQRGRRCFFIQSPWTPKDITQPIHRMYRRGQKNTVIADHLTLAKTIDHYVLKTCLDKQETINRTRKGYQHG